jgi:CRISPR/Cas system-associated protein Csm6
MSESVLKILLEELTTIQVVCLTKNLADGSVCNTVIEVSLEQLEKVDASASQVRCPICNAVLHASHFGGLGELARSISKMVKRKADIGVRFVIPQPKDK